MVFIPDYDETVATRVEAVPGVPSPFGLLSVATIVPPGDPHEMAGVKWLAMSCAAASVTPWCVTEVDDDVAEFYPKEFQRPTEVYAPPVTVYHGYECATIGQSYDEARTYALSGLTLGEPYALESWLWSDVLAPAATDLTPVGGAVGLAAGVGALEGALGEVYGGIGVLHVPLGAGTPLGATGSLIRDGARTRTWVGTLVALGAGYAVNTGPDGEPAAEGEAWIYISGPVVVRREEPNVVPDGDDGAVVIATNDRQVLVERTSVVGVECSVYAVRVEVGACT